MNFVILDDNLEQNRNDVIEYKKDEVVIGFDWKGNKKFECLKGICEVTYLTRTEEISTTKIKKDLGL